MKKTFIFCALLCITQLALAQEITKPQIVPSHNTVKVSYKALGSVIISGYKHTGTFFFSTFLNFGGPSIKMEYGKFGISYGMFPSLRFYKSDNPLVVSPSLGTGFQFTYKKIALALPMYYIVSPRTKTNIWVVSVGAGYKF